jgi:hypothetical protein
MSMTIRTMLVAMVLALAACGGKTKPAAAPPPADDDLTIKPHPIDDGKPETEYERRLRAACEDVGAKVSACAVEDTRNDKQHPPTADELAQLDQTAAIDKREYIKKCVAAEMSSRQIRVMEVCAKEEAACEPFLACLDHMKPEAGEH